MGEKPKRRGLMLVLSSPSGAGKTSLSRKLTEGDTETMLSVSTTTRPKRPGEQDGQDYNFVSQDDFHKMIDDGAFLEYATVFGHSYGTPAKPVAEALADGKDVLFDIDWQGTQQLSQKAHDDLVRIFILPPSIAALKERLITRAQDSNEEVESRMSKAIGEITHWAEYDYVLVNDDFDRCLDQIKSILDVERKRRPRQVGLSGFVKTLVENGA